MAAINNTDLCVFRPWEGAPGDLTCNICMEELAGGPIVASTPAHANHTFHRNCLEELVQQKAAECFAHLQIPIIKISYLQIQLDVLIAFASSLLKSPPSR